MPQPLTSTRSPEATVPTRSMPGISGCCRITPGRPARASPSLKLTLEYSTSTSTPSSPRSASVIESSSVACGPSSPVVTIHARMQPPYAGRSAEEDRCLVVALLRHRLELAERCLERHGRHLGALQRHHLTPLLVAGQ